MMTARTTATLDPDVVQQLKKLADERNAPFDVVVNETVRAGLEAAKIVRPPYKVASRPMGLRPEIDLTHALALADDLYDEEFVRKYQERKQRALNTISEDS